MSFNSVLGPGSSAPTYIHSSVSAYFACLASLCSPSLATMYALVDDLAMRISPSCCPVCYIKSMVKSCLGCFFSAKQIVRTENEIPALVFDPDTEVYTLQKLQTIDGESTMQLFQPPHPLITFHTHCAPSRESHLSQCSSSLGAFHRNSIPRRDGSPLQNLC